MKKFKPGDYLIIREEYDRYENVPIITIKNFKSEKGLVSWLLTHTDYYLEHDSIKSRTVADLNTDDDADVCQVYYLRLTNKGIKKERFI